MEQPGKQFEFWPPKMTIEELNEKLRKAGDRDREKGEDLVSKEDLTEALEGKGTKTEKILSPKKNVEKAREVLKELEEKEEKNKK